jgi:aminoglycoside 6'-N-acetyltransferase I
MRIINLPQDDGLMIGQTAKLLFDAFKESWPGAWPTIGAALEEVRESFDKDRISRVAVDEKDVVLGWIGAIEMYDGNVWELHPLAVSPGAQGRGVGRALVEDLEERVIALGGQTLWVGTDDEDNLTSLGGIDLYPNPLDHLSRIENLRRHPYEFYRRLGFVIVGVMPDANGFGKPDIYLAKRLVRRKE